MDSRKMTYADVLKNQSGYLNPGMDPRPLIPKAPRVRVSEEAVQKLRATIHGKSELAATSEPSNRPESSNQPECVEKKRRGPNRASAEQSPNQPLILASASAGLLPKVVLDGRCFMQSSVNSAYVSLLNPNEISRSVREGVMENPIEVADDSDNETVKLGENECHDQRSNASADVHLNASDFDANEFMCAMNDESSEVIKKVEAKPLPELDRMLRLNPTKALTKAKRRMESSFIDDYASRIKLFKREYRDEYEGEYTFVVKLGVTDNTVEPKETMTYCRITRLEDESKKGDEDYEPESEFEETYSDIDEKKEKAGVSSDVDEARKKANREALCFNPQKQYTRYNTKPVPGKPRMVHQIDEKPTETARYAWIGRYEVVPSDSTFNMFLNGFKQPFFSRGGPRIEEFGGVRYRYLRVGTNTVTSPLLQYNQFVIGNDFSIYRLGMNGSPNINLGVNPKARERRLPPPISQKYTIASLFWANELLKSQKAW